MSRESRFETLEREGSNFSVLSRIIVDNETGVNYLFVTSGYAGGLTPLLDAKGNPVISR